MRDVLFAIALLVALSLVAVGIATYTVGAALMAAGVMLAGWSWLVLSEGDVAIVADSEVDE